MSRKLTLSIVSVVALSFVLSTGDAEAKGFLTRQVAKVRAWAGKNLRTVKNIKRANTDRNAAYETAKDGKTNMGQALKKAWNGNLQRLTVGSEYKAAGKANRSEAVKHAGQSGKYVSGSVRMAGQDLKMMANGLGVAPEAGYRVAKFGALAGLGFGMSAAKATRRAAVGAKNYTVRKAHQVGEAAVHAKDVTVAATVAAKDYTVQKAGEAKQAVVNTGVAAYQRGEAAVAHTKTAVKQGVNNAAQRVVDKTSQKSALEQRVAKRERQKEIQGVLDYIHNLELPPLPSAGKTQSAKVNKVATRRTNLRRALNSNLARGMSDKRLGEMFGVSASTIAKDRKALGIGTAKQRLAAASK